MIKRFLLLIALLMVAWMVSGCGAGADSPGEPAGVNPSVPSIVQLQPVQSTVQTNTSISLRAKVLDGNGRVVPNTPVVFTNLSLLGVLSSTTATTDSLGFATVSLFSTDSGFATVQAEVNTGSGRVRDKRTVFFSVFDLVPVSGTPTLTLAVDNNNDGSYNDPSDFILLQTTDQAVIRATVLDRTGNPSVNDTVTFGADSSEATFPDGDVKQTNSSGEAFARIKVVPTELRDLTVPLNVNAVSTSTGAFNVITLFLSPVTVGNVAVSANPTSVDSGGTSAITSVVTTSSGAAVPDGTSVNFTAAGGSIEPFAQTAAGVATASLKAPTLQPGDFDQTVRVTASVGGKSGSTNVTVIAPAVTPVTPTTLAVNPTSATFTDCNVTPAPTATFLISGGTSPYHAALAVSSDPITVSAITGGSFTVSPTGCGSIPPGGGSADFNVLVTDSGTPAQVVTVKITLKNP